MWGGGIKVASHLTRSGLLETIDPLSDVRGSNNAGEKWSSVLVKTGVWDGWRRGDDNCQIDPAVLVVDDVLEAVKQILHE